jgi:chorismate mutase / prephenate dehydrogenase
VSNETSEQGSDQLNWLRSEIERIDRSIIQLIDERVHLALRVGEVKRAAGLPTLDPPREAAIVRRAGALAREAGLDDEPIRDIFWRLIRLSRQAQVDES